VFRGTATEAKEYFSNGPTRGEFVLLIEGAPEKSTEPSDEAILDMIVELGRKGITGRSLVEASITATGAPRRKVYRLVTEFEEENRADAT